MVWFLISLVIMSDGHVGYNSRPFVSESACKAAAASLSPKMAEMAPDAYALECVPVRLYKPA